MRWEGDGIARRSRKREPRKVVDAWKAAISDRCEICGGPIGQERLLQDPLLTRCPQHSGQG